MTPEQQRTALKLKAQARLRLKQPTAPAVASGPLEGWGSAFKAGIDQPLEAIGTTAKALGADTIGDALQGAIDTQPAQESATSKFMNGDFLGFDPTYLPKAIVEQSGQFAGSIISRAAGVAVGGTVGSLAGPVGTGAGAVAGGFAGPALFEGLQILGPTAIERAKNNGRDKPDSSDWAAALATASASGALNALAPGAEGMLKRMLIEGGTEGVQNVVQDIGETTGTDKGTDINIKEAIGSGILGAGSAGAVDTTVKAGEVVGETVGKALPSRTDKGDYTADDAAVADLLTNLTDGDPSKLGNVSTTEANVGAQSYTIAAMSHLRKEELNIVSRMKKLAKERGQTQTATDLDKISGESGKFTAANSEFSLRNVEKDFEGHPDLERLKSVHRQIAKVQGFNRSKGDMGGISQFTKNLDPFDKRNENKTTTGIGLGFAGFSNPLVPVALIGANRVARGIDTITNRRSKVKRYVDSVKASGVKAEPIMGDTSLDTINQLTRAVQEAESDIKFKKKFEQDYVKAEAANKAFDDLQVEKDEKNRAAFVKAYNQAIDQNKIVDAKQKARLAKQVASKVAQDAAVKEMQNQAAIARLQAGNTQKMFETGEIPKSTEAFKYFRPYEIWANQTGVKHPAALYSILSNLETDPNSGVPPGTAEIYKSDIRKFPTKGKGKDATYAIQEAVRQANDPSYRPVAQVQDEANLNRVMAYVSAAKVTPSKNRREEKSKEGSRRSQNLIATIEAAKNRLRPPVYQALWSMQAALNRPDMSKDDRIALLETTLPKLFKTKAEQAIWKNEFYPLAIHGNDKRIYQEDVEQAKKEEALSAKIKKIKPKKAKKSAEQVTPKKPELTSDTVETTADKAIEKLNTPVEEEAEPVSDAEKMVEATEPAPPAPKKAKGKTGLAKSIQERMDAFDNIVNIAETRRQEFDNFIAELKQDKSTSSRVLQLIYGFANDQLTVNMVIDAYGEKFDVPYDVATTQVMGALNEWKASGDIAIFQPKGGSLIVNGEYQTDANGERLKVLQIELIAPEMVETLNVAKAINSYEKMINPVAPDFQYSTNIPQSGIFKLLPDHAPGPIDESFTPYVNFVNDLRNQQFSIQPDIFNHIETAVEGKAGGKVGMIGKVLKPVNEETGRTDKTGMNTVAQIKWQLNGSNQFRMEWFGGRNLRTYSRNGLVHSQAGDIMKGLMRAGDKYKVGDTQALNFMFHAFGNLLGNDKDAPATRRATIFQPGMMDALLKFAENPFPAQAALVTSKGNKTATADLMEDVDEYFQRLNAATEVKALVDFARARNKDKADWPADKLLQDDGVQQDIAENFESNFLVQFDASNNAYQIMGLVTGQQDVLMSTGLMPRSNNDPDEEVGADIYMASAKAVAEVIPEIKALGLSDKDIRKIFKKPISTYLYAAALQSRKAAFEKTMKKMVNPKGGNRPVVGIGETEGLIQVPNEVIQGMTSTEGFVFRDDHLDPKSNSSKKLVVRKRVVQNEKGRYQVQVSKARNGKFNAGGASFETAEQAISSTFEQDLYGRMSAALIADFEARYPEVKDYMKFFSDVSAIAKARGQDYVRVPTPDGMVLDYSFKEKTEFAAVPVEVDSKDGPRVVNIGVATPDTKITGRGLSAFATHSLDAYVLRETHKRMKQGGLKAFNPIHDSIGFHPSEAARGQETFLQVMQELGAQDFNYFVNILLENNMVAEFQAMGGTMPVRKAVEPQPAKAIPTAFA